MGLFNQKKDTVEWIEYRPDVLFYKWKNRVIKKGSRLVIRAGQKAIFYSGGGAVGGKYCAGQAVFIIAYNKLSYRGQVQDGFLIQHRRAHLAVFLPGGAALPGRV